MGRVESEAERKARSVRAGMKTTQARYGLEGWYARASDRNEKLERVEGVVQLLIDQVDLRGGGGRSAVLVRLGVVEQEELRAALGLLRELREDGESFAIFEARRARGRY